MFTNETKLNSHNDIKFYGDAIITAIPKVIQYTCSLKSAPAHLVGRGGGVRNHLGHASFLAS